MPSPGRATPPTIRGAGARRRSRGPGLAARRDAPSRRCRGASEMSATGAARPAGALEGFADVADYVALLKPRVMSLVVFTALVGLVRADSGIHPVIGFAALLPIAIGAGVAGSLNMWWDADIDARMARTAQRPVPAGRIAPGEALTFGVMLAVASVAMLGLFAGWLAAGLLAFTIFFYAVLYTMIL